MFLLQVYHADHQATEKTNNHLVTILESLVMIIIHDVINNNNRMWLDF